jgi:hypothetical protein
MQSYDVSETKVNLSLYIQNNQLNIWLYTIEPVVSIKVKGVVTTLTDFSTLAFA